MGVNEEVVSEPQIRLFGRIVQRLPSCNMAGLVSTCSDEMTVGLGTADVSTVRLSQSKPADATQSPCSRSASDASDTDTFPPWQSRHPTSKAEQLAAASLPPDQQTRAAVGCAAADLRTASMTDAAVILQALQRSRAASARATAAAFDHTSSVISGTTTKRRSSAPALPHGSKLCSACQQVKPHSLFHCCKAKRDGLQDRCKVCRAALDRQRQQQARATGSGTKASRKRQLCRSQSEPAARPAAKRVCGGVAAAFKEWAASPPGAAAISAADAAFLHSASGAFTAAPQAPIVPRPPTNASPPRRRYPQWDASQRLAPAAPQAPSAWVQPRHNGSARVSAPGPATVKATAPAHRPPSYPTARRLKADMRLGRIAAALTAASSLRRAHGSDVHKFRRLLGSVLLAGCLLVRIQQLRAHAARQAVLLRGWQQAAAALQQQSRLTMPRFQMGFHPGSAHNIMLRA